MNDFEEMLCKFESFGVRYLVVGAHAVMLYTEPRFTKDLDIFVEASPENGPRVYAALAEFGAPLQSVSVEEFCAPEICFQIGVPPWRIDILTEVSGIDFATAWTGRVRAKFECIDVNYIGRDALMKNKHASGRPKDLLDAAELEETANWQKDLGRWDVAD